MKTNFGMNPSFHTWTGRQIVFSDLIKRGKSFELFDANPRNAVGIGEAQVGELGWPIGDQGRVGVRVFGDMGKVPSGIYFAASPGASGVEFELRGRGVTPVTGVPNQWKVDGDLQGTAPMALVWLGYAQPILHIEKRRAIGIFDLKGLSMFAPFTPIVIRDLDWVKTNRMRQPGERRVQPNEPLQGTERGMALEHVISVANLAKAYLWHTIQPRYELSKDAWKAELRSEFAILASKLRLPPVLELGNELWNSDFPAAKWLQKVAQERGVRWTTVAAEEIATMHEAAVDVFGAETPFSAPFTTFVGGHIGDSKVLNSILKGLPFAPTLAGPATYVGVTKTDDDNWTKNSYVPSLDELFASMERRLVEIRTKLDEHRAVCVDNGVKYLAVYEAGQSMNAQHAPWRATGIAAQREERMASIYSQLRTALQLSDVAVANWYSLTTSQTPPAPVAPFGLLEGEDFPELPKARAARGG